MIELGSNVIDKVTKVKGIVTGRCQYLHGSPQCLVEFDEAEMREPQWFANERLEVVG